MASKNINQVANFIKMYFKRTLKNLTIAVILLLNCMACGGQVDLKENIQTKSDMAIIEISDTNLIVNNSPQKDSIIFNQYLKGKKDGLWKEYYATGQLKCEGSYIVGKKEGIHREWAENGQLDLEGNYKDGLEQGLMKWFYDGHIAGEGLMKDGKRDGVWKVYSLGNGKLAMESNFKNGNPDGQILKLYHDNGQLSQDNFWLNDKVISTVCWDENGNKIKCD